MSLSDEILSRAEDIYNKSAASVSEFYDEITSGGGTIIGNDAFADAVCDQADLADKLVEILTGEIDRG